MKLIKYLFVVLLLSASQVILSQDDFETKLLTQFYSITSEEMMTWVDKLCSPEFNGRLTLNLPQIDGTVIRKNYTYPDEYYPGMNSGNGEISAEVVFSMEGYRTMSIGTTGGYKKVYYHLPGDDPDAITIDIMEDVAKMIYVALTNMANDLSLNSR